MAKYATKFFRFLSICYNPLYICKEFNESVTNYCFYMLFSKMQGIGNDYVYVNGLVETVSDPESLAIRISDRHFGVGSDGLVLILPSERADFRMRMFNADGSEAEMCGNASRCVGKYVYDKGLTPKTSLTLETGSGIRHLQLFPVDGKVERVTVDMGIPDFSIGSVPVLWHSPEMIQQPVMINGCVYRVTAVSMGNPHAVVFLPEIDMLNLYELGPLFENHSLFPKRTNTEFVERMSSDRLRMRVWERGAGETLACGTGACAAAAAAIRCGFCGKKVRVDLKGGPLFIDWEAETMKMTGAAVMVFEGEW